DADFAASPLIAAFRLYAVSSPSTEVSPWAPFSPLNLTVTVDDSFPYSGAVTRPITPLPETTTLARNEQVKLETCPDFGRSSNASLPSVADFTRNGSSVVVIEPLVSPDVVQLRPELLQPLRVISIVPSWLLENFPLPVTDVQ